MLVGVDVDARAGVCLRACSLTNPACKAHATYLRLSAPPYFSSLSHKRQDFRKNVTEYKMRVFIFSTILFGTVLILRRIKRDIVKNMKTSSCKVPVILVGF